MRPGIAVVPPASITTAQLSTVAAEAVPTEVSFPSCMITVSPGTIGSRQSPDTMTPILLTATRMRVLLRFPAQCDERVKHQPIDLEALAQRALAGAKSPLRWNADLIDARLSRRCFDALDQLRHLAFEGLGRPEQVGPERDEEITVLALDSGQWAPEQCQRLNHERKPEAFVAAERQQGAAACLPRIPGRLAVPAERDAVGEELAKPLAQPHLGHHVGRCAHVE